MDRFGLIGDVHAEDGFLAVALDRLARERVDRVLCVGDIADGRGSVNRCVELLRRHRVDCVRGNHDRWLLGHEARDDWNATRIDTLSWETRSHLAHLPLTLRFDTAAGALLLCHGLGEDDSVFVDEALHGLDPKALRRERGRLLRLVEPGVSLVACGHTHRRGVRRLGRLTLIDAGTLRGGDNPCFSVVDLAERAVQFFDLDEDGTVMQSERMSIMRSSG